MTPRPVRTRGTRIRNRYFLLADAVLLFGSVTLLYTLRFDGLAWMRFALNDAVVFSVVGTLVTLTVYLATGLYRRLWMHASVPELEHLLSTGILAGLASVAVGAWVLPATGLTASRIPNIITALFAVLALAVPALVRLLPRIVMRPRASSAVFRDAKRTLIVGAGNAGQQVAKELLNSPHGGILPVGFVDDDPRKRNVVILGLPVVGTLPQLAKVAEQLQIERVVVAIPSASGAVVRQVVEGATKVGADVQTVPGLLEILQGRISINTIRPVEIQDLLRRAPVTTDLRSVAEALTDRVVLVTGAGGSIGSELCRQVAQMSPARLLLLGHGENSIFRIHNELRERFPDVPMTPLIADVREERRIRSLMSDWRPAAVFHAAAHKHVPLMEENVGEAILNNVLGTRCVVRAAEACGVERFVLISTDKAVRPTSVMGATKRIAEMQVQMAAGRNGQRFVSVRFGNVLGSRGSVVPTFMEQIEKGGPVRVTHPDMRRFFMTIPEAVQLVLQAGAMGAGREVFVLDMGEPVRIVDLANDLIRLCGLEPGADIEVEYSGLRPGEKLYEEMFFDHESADVTEHPKVLRGRVAIPASEMGDQIDALIRAATEGDPESELRARLACLVPDYRRPARDMGGASASLEPIVMA